jgi:hypothetical protein
MPVVLAFVTFMASAVAVDASPTKENAQTYYEATVVKCLKHTHIHTLPYWATLPKKHDPELRVQK